MFFSIRFNYNHYSTQACRILDYYYYQLDATRLIGYSSSHNRLTHVE